MHQSLSSHLRQHMDFSLFRERPTFNRRRVIRNGEFDMLPVSPFILSSRFKTLFKGFIIFIACFLATQVSSGQGGFTLSINPSSGLPGTTIELSPNPNYPDTHCFANGQSFGGKSYTVPTDASGTISFHCESGTGEFWVQTNSVIFTVIPPDTDGDGILDSLDACPSQYALTPDGCPVQTGSNPPSNLPPNNPPPSSPPQSNLPPADTNSENTFIPARLPNDGGCHVATRANVFVNVRERPTIESEIIASLDPSQTYEAFWRFNDGENLWYWVTIFEGWVSGQVARQSGACASMPFGAEDGEIDVSQAHFIGGRPTGILMNFPFRFGNFRIDFLLRDYFQRFLFPRIQDTLLNLNRANKLDAFLTTNCDIEWEPDGQFLFTHWMNDGQLDGILEEIDNDLDHVCAVAQSLLEERNIDILRTFLADSCDIEWEPDGQFLFSLWIEDGHLDTLLEGINVYPDAVCTIAHSILDPDASTRDEDPALDDGTRIPHSDDTEDIMALRRLQEATDYVDNGDFTHDEERLQVFMASCDIDWEPDGREIFIYMLSLGVDAASVLEEVEFNLNGCIMLHNLADMLETDEDGNISINPIDFPDRDIVTDDNELVRPALSDDSDDDVDDPDPADVAPPIEASSGED